MQKPQAITPLSFKMDTRTLNVGAEPVGLVKQSTKVKHDRKVAKAMKAALHNAQQGHDDCKKARRKTRYAGSQFSLPLSPS